MKALSLPIALLAALCAALSTGCSGAPGTDAPGTDPGPLESSTETEAAQAAQEIVDRSIEHHGGDLYESRRVDLTITSSSGSFDLTSEVQGDHFRHTVSSMSADGRSRRVRVSNDTVEEWANEQPRELDEADARRARDFVMARVYFPFLPYRLNDPSVRKEDLGLEAWGDRELRKVRVTFEEGSSTDAQDVYLYWFDPDTARLEQLAYSFETGAGGLRLRKGFDYRRVDGILFFDTENWGVSGHGRDVAEITPAFADPETGEMEKISTVTLSNIRVREVGDLAEAGAGKTMAVTVDDLPFTRVPKLAEARAATDRLLGTFTEMGIPAVGFVNEGKLYEGDKPLPGLTALLGDWLDAGLELGNHTYSHPSLHQVPLDEYLDDLRRGERTIRDLAAARDLPPPRWFRHPYLHTGRSLEDKEAVEALLAERGYAVAPVTHDNAEYIYAWVYDRAVEDGDRQMQEKIGDAYVRYMLEQLAFVEGNSRELFGREIPQVLLIHANRLNADHFGRLAREIADRGYRWVTLETALEDPAFDSADTYTGPAGITWLHRWALTRGVDKGFYQGEAEPDAFVMERYERRSNG